MLIQHFAHLRCPVFRSNLRLEILEFKNKTFEKGEKEVVWTGILFAETGPFFYPIINGVPRVLVESFLDYQDFFQKHLPDFQNRKLEIEDGFKGLVKHVVSKNYKTNLVLFGFYPNISRSPKLYQRVRWGCISL